MPVSSDPRSPRGRLHVIDVPVYGAACLRPLRRTLAALLAGQPDDLQMDVALVTTELVTNAVEHAVPPHRVRVATGADGSVHIAVTDSAPDTAPTPGVSRLGRHRGRGMTVVAGVARWGVRRTRTTKTIWAVLGPVSAH